MMVQGGPGERESVERNACFFFFFYNQSGFLIVAKKKFFFYGLKSLHDHLVLLFL